MELINFKGKNYPAFQATGNASQFAIPFAKHFCKGIGYDIGCMKAEWAFPGAIPIDLSFNDGYHATNLPKTKNGLVDYIFSSHCLEHIDGWVGVLDYWKTNLVHGGIIFLYLPDYSQEYWRPWNNRKHRNIFTPQILEDYFKDRGFVNIFKSGVDLNNAFMIVAQNG